MGEAVHLEALDPRYNHGDDDTLKASEVALNTTANQGAGLTAGPFSLRIPLVYKSSVNPSPLAAKPQPLFRPFPLRPALALRNAFGPKGILLANPGLPSGTEFDTRRARRAPSSALGANLLGPRYQGADRVDTTGIPMYWAGLGTFK